MVLALSLSPTGDWTQAAAIMTFAIPVGIFVVVATWLYFCTRGHTPCRGTGTWCPPPAGTGSGRHAAGAPRPAAAQQPPAQQPPAAPQPPPAQPPGGGYPQGGGAPGGGGYGRPDGMEGR